MSQQGYSYFTKVVSLRGYDYGADGSPKETSGHVSALDRSTGGREADIQLLSGNEGGMSDRNLYRIVYPDGTEEIMRYDTLEERTDGVRPRHVGAARLNEVLWEDGTSTRIDTSEYDTRFYIHRFFDGNNNEYIALTFFPNAGQDLSDFIEYHRFGLGVAGFKWDRQPDGSYPAKTFQGSQMNVAPIPPDVCYHEDTHILFAHSNGRFFNKKIKDINVGDEIVTHNGTKEVKWITQRTVKAHGDHAPILLKKGFNGLVRDLRVSQLHRIGVNIAGANFFIKAKHLVDGEKVIIEESSNLINYFHLAVEGHEAINVHGTISETLLMGEQMFNHLTQEQQDDLRINYPDLYDRIGKDKPVYEDIGKGKYFKALKGFYND